MNHTSSSRYTAPEAAALMRVAPCLEPRRFEFAQAVASAYAVVSRFAASHGWEDHVRVFFDGGVEVFMSQSALWWRIRELHNLSEELPLPTPGLAAALECRVLMAVTPEEYARIAPGYGSAPGAFVRLLAHEMAHRLHVAVLGGDEDAMGPAWFYEGFAVVASGDLPEPPACALTWEALSSPGPEAYRRYGALLRLLMRRTPLPQLVQRASDTNFEEWTRRLLSGAAG